MAKGKKSHKGKTHAKRKEVVKEPKKSALPIKLIKNVLILVGVLLLLNGLKTYNPGYNWVVETLVLKNLDQMKKFKDLTHQQKLEAKLGFTARYFDFVTKNTPEDAIILMAPDSILQPPPGVHYSQQRLSGYSKVRSWTSYFLYPRKLVYEDRKDEYPALYDSITHVAVTLNWGYDKLPYRVSKQSEHSIMPIKMPK